MSHTSHRSGFVCVAGRPNVGKSTLVNRLVGAPVSITTRKPQTTRTRILGVMHRPGAQAVLMDTPGIHEATGALNERMVGYAAAALAEADLVLMMAEPFPPRWEEPGPQERLVLKMASAVPTPAILAVNKIDRASEDRVLRTLDWYGRTGRFTEIVPISALKGKGVERLEALIPSYLPEGPAYFEPGQTSDQSDAALIGELVRQAVFRNTGQEIPYSTAVRIERIEQRKDLLVVEGRIFVERESQKGILIGKGGSALKRIGRQARIRIEALLGTRVYLGLHVAVLKDWSRDPRRLDELGYPEK